MFRLLGLIVLFFLIYKFFKLITTSFNGVLDVFSKDDDFFV